MEVVMIVGLERRGKEGSPGYSEEKMIGWKKE
jgi:hypothetical protein